MKKLQLFESYRVIDNSPQEYEIFCDHLFRNNELSAFFSHSSLPHLINIDTRATVKWSAHRWQPGESLFSH